MASKVQSNPQGETSMVMRCAVSWLMFLGQVLLFGSLAVFIYWVLYYGGGVAWANDRSKMFNLHSILMLGGFIFMNGQAIMVYRSFPCCKKIYNKILHTILFVLSISAITIGMVSAIQAQHEQDENPSHFYSLHSWIGLTTVGLFALQFVIGFISFLVLLCCDTATAKFRQRLLPTHITFGLIIFNLAAAACLTGLMQTARNDKKVSNYKYFSEPGIVLNVVGAAIVGLVVLLPYIIRNGQCRRQGTLNIN